MKSTLAWIFGLGAIVLLLVVLRHERRAVGLARAELAAQRQKAEVLRRASAEAEAALTDMQKRAGALTAQLRAEPSLSDQLAKVRDAMAARSRTLHAWRSIDNARLYQQLDLPADTRQKLEDLQVDHWMRMQDISDTAKAEGLRLSDPEMRAMINEENDQFGAAESALLGPSDYAAAQEYSRLTSGRMVADAIAGNVYGTASPLTAAQAAQVAQIVANNSPSYQQGGPALTRDMDFQGVVQQAQQVLSPTQMSALQNYLMGISAQRSVTLYRDPTFTLPPP